MYAIHKLLLLGGVVVLGVPFLVGVLVGVLAGVLAGVLVGLLGVARLSTLVPLAAFPLHPHPGLSTANPDGKGMSAKGVLIHCKPSASRQPDM